MNLNLLPKNLIVSNIVSTLKDDPVQGISKLLEMAQNHTKSAEGRQLLNEINGYYQNHGPAKMQIKNLVHNTSRKTLATFVESLIDGLSKAPFTLHSLRWVSIDHAEAFKQQLSTFPLIDLKNLNVASKEVLSILKQAGVIFFATIDVSDENLPIVTSNETVRALVKLGTRGIFYRMETPDPFLKNSLESKIHQIRQTLPILAFYIKKDAPHGTSQVYKIKEEINEKMYVVKLRV